MAAVFDLAEMDAGSWNWRADAACRGEDPELFFPERGAAMDAAVAICAGCSVRPECLEHGLRHERHGVWGGTSQRQRRALRKRMGIRLIELAPVVEDLDDDEDDEESDEWQ